MKCKLHQKRSLCVTRSYRTVRIVHRLRVAGDGTRHYCKERNRTPVRHSMFCKAYFFHYLCTLLDPYFSSIEHPCTATVFSTFFLFNFFFSFLSMLFSVALWPFLFSSSTVLAYVLLLSAMVSWFLLRVLFRFILSRWHFPRSIFLSSSRSCL